MNELGRMTQKEFEDFAALPENADRYLEHVAGITIELRHPETYRSLVESRVAGRLVGFLYENRLGWATGLGGYAIFEDRYRPRCAFIGNRKQVEQPWGMGWNPNSPDLVAEFLSPTDVPGMVRIKLINYLRIGAIVWLFDENKERVEVYAPSESPKVVDIRGTLDCGNILPGFTLNVQTIFRGRVP
jgi:Uma2 family endonuclease